MNTKFFVIGNFVIKDLAGTVQIATAASVVESEHIESAKNTAFEAWKQTFSKVSGTITGFAIAACPYSDVKAAVISRTIADMTTHEDGPNQRN
jgi:hypothetical protein